MTVLQPACRRELFDFALLQSIQLLHSASASVQHRRPDMTYEASPRDARVHDSNLRFESLRKVLVRNIPDPVRIVAMSTRTVARSRGRLLPKSSLGIGGLRLGLNADVVVDGIPQSLFAAQIPFGRLDGDVCEQELNLLEFSPGLVT